MELFGWRGVTGFPDNVPIQQKAGFNNNKIKKTALHKQPIFFLMGKLSGKPVTPLYLKSALGSQMISKQLAI